MLRSSFFLPLTAWALMPASAVHAQPIEPAAPAAVATAPAGISATTTSPGDDSRNWKFVLRASALATYDDIIFIQETNPSDDVIFRIAPSLGAGIGNFREEFAPLSPTPHFLARTGEEELTRKDFAFIGYTPEALLFSQHPDENEINHDARLSARREEERWNVQGDLHFQSIADTDIDVGRRLRQTYYTAALGGEHALSGKLMAGAKVSGYRSEYAGGYSSTDTRATGYLDYQVAPKTTVGLGGAFGYLDVPGGANQRYQQPLVQVRYQPTEKISVAGRAGEEFRQFDSDIDDRTQFVFALNGSYDATDSTALTVSGRRDTQSSAEYSGENIVQTLYEGGVRQRFWQRVYLALDGGAVRNDYENNRAVAAVFRRDDYWFYKVAASGDFTRRGSLALSYEYRKNDSSVPGFGFTENLLTLGASFLF